MDGFLRIHAEEEVSIYLHTALGPASGLDHATT